MRLLGLTFILLWIALFVGWIMNLMALIQSIGGVLDTIFIARIVGIFIPPLGGIFGFVL